MAPRLVDLSHTIEDGMITYRGLPAPVISDHLSRKESRAFYAPGTEFHIGRIKMVANTGTYLDSPFHRYPDGRDLAQLELTCLANLEGLVIRLNDRDSIGPAIISKLFSMLDIKGKAVLFETRWDRHWRTDEYWSGKHPFLSAEAAEHLAKSEAALVGIDSYNIDDTNDGSRPAHSILLAHDIPIVEHLCGLNQLPDDGFRFFAVPVKVSRFGTFPVRAFAVVEESHR